MGFFNLFKSKEHIVQQTPSLSADEIFEQGKACASQNIEKAFQLYLKAAEMGLPAAMHKVGQSYLYKHSGAPFDLVKSAHWYEEGAKHGYVPSMMMISQCYMAGAGVEESDDTAKKWLTQAAQSGDEKTVEIATRRLNDFEKAKVSMKVLYQTAKEMGGIPPK